LNLTRLESEFRSTLETLKGRMEVAYNAKEQQVEAELGTMREQLSSELRRAVGGSSEKADARALLTDSDRGSMRN